MLSTLLGSVVGEVMKKLEVGETVAGLKLKFACLVVGVDTSKLPLGVSVVT